MEWSGQKAAMRGVGAVGALLCLTGILLTHDPSYPAAMVRFLNCLWPSCFVVLNLWLASRFWRERVRDSRCCGAGKSWGQA
eukprot:3675058-Rhodomonas_salina.3